jgi:hypothetical protein
MQTNINMESLHVLVNVVLKAIGFYNDPSTIENLNDLILKPSCWMEISDSSTSMMFIL